MCMVVEILNSGEKIKFGIKTERENYGVCRAIENNTNMLLMYHRGMEVENSKNLKLILNLLMESIHLS
jgi:hypothetical protein